MPEPNPDPDFKVTELTGWSLAQLAFGGGDGARLDTALRRLGLSLPVRVGETVGYGATRVLRLAPDRIWILAEPGGGRLDPVMEPFSLLPLTGGRRRFRITGSRSAEVLAKGIALDLEGSGLPPGRAAQTQLHRMPILLHRHRMDSFDLFVSRSFAESVEDWIADAALETGWRPARADRRPAA